MRRGVLIAAALLLIIAFSPTLVMIVWRGIHRARVSYMGITVSVPYGWMTPPRAWMDTAALAFIKVPMTIFPGRSRGLMSIEPSRGGLKVSDDGSFQIWRHAFESLYVPRGYTVDGPISAGGDSYCLAAKPPAPDLDAVASCYFRSGEWYASFTGSSRDLDVLISTVRKIQ